jgi:hypothetical protein
MKNGAAAPFMPVRHGHVAARYVGGHFQMSGLEAVERRLRNRFGARRVRVDAARQDGVDEAHVQCSDLRALRSQLVAQAVRQRPCGGLRRG